MYVLVSRKLMGNLHGSQTAQAGSEGNCTCYAERERFVGLAGKELRPHLLHIRERAPR
jgi:hypothetical protein